MLETNKLKIIIRDLQLVIKESNLSISQELLLENSIKIYLSEKINESKQQNIKAIQEERTNEQITESQDAFIRKNEADLRLLGFDLDNIKNKQDAFKVIGEYKKMKEEENEKRRKSNTDY